MILSLWKLPKYWEAEPETISPSYKSVSGKIWLFPQIEQTLNKGQGCNGFSFVFCKRMPRFCHLSFPFRNRIHSISGWLIWFHTYQVLLVHKYVQTLARANPNPNEKQYFRQIPNQSACFSISAQKRQEACWQHSTFSFLSNAYF